MLRTSPSPSLSPSLSPSPSPSLEEEKKGKRGEDREEREERIERIEERGLIAVLVEWSGALGLGLLSVCVLSCGLRDTYGLWAVYLDTWIFGLWAGLEWIVLCWIGLDVGG